MYGPSWCQICPHGSFCCLYGPRVKTNHGAGFVCWWCVVSGSYSQGWEDGDQMVSYDARMSGKFKVAETSELQGESNLLPSARRGQLSSAQSGFGHQHGVDHWNKGLKFPLRASQCHFFCKRWRPKTEGRRS